MGPFAWACRLSLAAAGLSLPCLAWVLGLRSAGLRTVLGSPCPGRVPPPSSSPVVPWPCGSRRGSCDAISQPAGATGLGFVGCPSTLMARADDNVAAVDPIQQHPFGSASEIPRPAFRNRSQSPFPSSSVRLDSTFSRLDPQAWPAYSANTVGRNRSTQHPWGSNLDIALLYD